MRSVMGLLIVLALCLASGCATYADLFSVFGSGYSGGTTRSDKQQQFSSDVSSYGN